MPAIKKSGTATQSQCITVTSLLGDFRGDSEPAPKADFANDADTMILVKTLAATSTKETSMFQCFIVRPTHVQWDSSSVLRWALQLSCTKACVLLGAEVSDPQKATI